MREQHNRNIFLVDVKNRQFRVLFCLAPRSAELTDADLLDSVFNTNCDVIILKDNSTYKAEMEEKDNYHISYENGYLWMFRHQDYIYKSLRETDTTYSLLLKSKFSDKYFAITWYKKSNLHPDFSYVDTSQGSQKNTHVVITHDDEMSSVKYHVDGCQDIKSISDFSYASDDPVITGFLRNHAYEVRCQT